MRIDKATSQIQAVNHTAAMAKVYPNEIQQCIDSSKIYTTSTELIPKTSLVDVVEQKLIRMDSVSAGKILSREGKVCILNFASYKHPGGGFITGSIAQEECLCHESILYNVISSNRFKPYYEYNQKHLNRGMYKNRGIYTPDVLFVDELKLPKFKADVLTCASPNYCFHIAQRVPQKDNFEALASRIDFVKKVLVDNDVEIAILGAFGCGVFHQDPNVVAKLFIDTFRLRDTGRIRKVYYAIPGGVNYSMFERVLKYNR